MHGSLAHHLHAGGVPGQHIKIILQRHIAQGAVVLIGIHLQIGGQVPGLLLIKSLFRKLLRQRQHLLRIRRRGKQYSRIIRIFLPVVSAEHQRHIILFVLLDQVLNRQNGPKPPAVIGKLRDLGPLHQPLPAQIPYLIAESGDNLTLRLNQDRQLPVLRQNRQVRSSGVLPLIVRVAAEFIHLPSEKPERNPGDVDIRRLMIDGMGVLFLLGVPERRPHCQYRQN